MLENANTIASIYLQWRWRDASTALNEHSTRMNAKAMASGLFILLSLKYGGILDKSHDFYSLRVSCA